MLALVLNQVPGVGYNFFVLLVVIKLKFGLRKCAATRDRRNTMSLVPFEDPADYEEEYAEDFSKEENNPKRQKALEKNARRVYESDRD